MNSRIFTLTIALLGLPALAGAENRENLRRTASESSASIRQLLEYQRQYQADLDARTRAFTGVTQTASPLEALLNSLVQEVLALRRDNDALRAELDTLKTSVRTMQETQETADKKAQGAAGKKTK
ncbi:MAG: hypothetical protein LBC18_02830 [Opitutaceae bacterium]|jgi:predicted nuclease with TOPRIM domain|nr:hypothetical protein [Opitutaceae bacterium]